MKFLCLCYYDTDAFARLSAEEAAKIEPACKPHDARLKATGKVRVIGSLALPQQWTTFVPGTGSPDEAKDAKQVASRHPAANFGAHLGFAVEVRPCEVYEDL